MFSHLFPSLLTVIEHVNNSSNTKLVAAVVVLAALAVAGRNMRNTSKTQRKEMRRLKWKMGWMVFKNYFGSKKFSFGDFLIILLFIGVGVGAILVFGFLGLLIFLGGMIWALSEMKKMN